MRIDDDFRDLAPLRPSLDPDRWGRMVGAVEAAAAPELARRALLPDAGVMMLLSSWRRPALTAAAVASLLAGVFMLQGTPAATAETPGLAESLGYPATVTEWVEGGSMPSVEELLLAMESE